MSDLLQDSAIAFSKLLKYKHVAVQFYEKNILQTILVVFETYHFKHLSGLHKCADIDIPKPAETLYRLSLKGKITLNNISNSKKYLENDISGRLNAILNLEKNLRDTKRIYRFNRQIYIRNFGDTQLLADYFFKMDYIPPASAPFFFYFVRRDKQSDVSADNVFYPVSIFSGKNRDIATGQKAFNISGIKFVSR